ncbi:hypothetical protein [Stieleria varia]|uniref:Uncharacterized protein n=1 Tax=Stieleria varia TaxID=2528005 RepID=A0A5C6A2Y4_9BACT|nr:hypothetical protein [Stieleria varia]TWT92763.1 hypothetical protein Pla52n_61280 [Stieleria varia]
MTVTKIIVRDTMKWIRRLLPGAVVLLIVMLLLHGWSGTAQAIRVQTHAMLTGFFGPGDDVAGVIAHTLPLALASALATFAVVSKWLTFESFSSVVILSCIILAGTSVGGFLRCVLPQPASVVTQVDDASPLPSLAVIDVKPSAAPVDQLRQLDWWAKPDLSRAAQREIAPVALFPKASGLIGLVFTMFNQVLGFMVAYQPRLFAAAVIAGGSLGWGWHSKLQSLQQRVLEFADGETLDGDVVQERLPRRRAA